MKKWFFGWELLERWDCTPTEFLGHIKAGLPAYDGEIDRRIFDIDSVPHQKAKTIEEIIKYPPIFELMGDLLEKRDVYYDEQTIAEMVAMAYVAIIPPDCEAMSFVLPTTKAKALTLFAKIKSFRFKYQDISEYERNNGLCLIEHQNDIIPDVVENAAPLPEKPDTPIPLLKNKSQREESRAKITANAAGHTRGRSLQTNEAGATSETPLNSYKEIAKHFGVCVDTVRKSFKKQGCPIHRYNGKVYAYPTELNKWRNSQDKKRKKK